MCLSFNTLKRMVLQWPVLTANLMDVGLRWDHISLGDFCRLS